MRARNHKDLKAWMIAMDFVEDVYRLSRALPAEERFTLCVQLRRAAVSIPANIAEGAGRASPADFARFVAIASGSLSELETLILLCERLGLFEGAQAAHQKIRVVRQMLASLRRALIHAAG